MKLLRWLILGGTLFFVIKAFKNHWGEVTAMTISPTQWLILTIAVAVTLLAHIWGGWIWTKILHQLNQPVPAAVFIQVYLKTNIAKYLPGNVWHHYGRIVAAKNADVPPTVATLSVLLEPILMAAAALIMILVLGVQTVENQNLFWQFLPFCALAMVLTGIHPRCLNPVMGFLSKLKLKESSHDSLPVAQLQRYLFIPLLGELGFLILRGGGFIVTVLALLPVDMEHIPLLLGAFSCAWLFGFLVPGAPGGLGVFEVTAIGLLEHRFPSGGIISAITLYRFVSIIAEIIGAALAALNQRLTQW